MRADAVKVPWPAVAAVVKRVVKKPVLLAIAAARNLLDALEEDVRERWRRGSGGGW